MYETKNTLWQEQTPCFCCCALLVDADDQGTGDATSDQLMEKIGRAEQMHLTTIQMFMFEKARYEGVVQMYRERFGKTYTPDEEQGNGDDDDGDGDDDALIAGDFKADSKSIADEKSETSRGMNKACGDQWQAEKSAQIEESLLDTKGDSDSESEHSALSGSFD